MRNRAQPFMKVALPPGASMLSVEVAGAAAKPVEGKDGTRVPLLRPGFRPDGPYSVSFVYLNAGTPFAKKGDMQMTLPKMDVPVNVVEWELFVPDRYRVDHFDGNVLSASLWESDRTDRRASPAAWSAEWSAALLPVSAGAALGSQRPPGRLSDALVDQSGAPIPGATVIVEGGGQNQAVITDKNGNYLLSGLPSGPLVVSGQLSGFATVRQSVVFDQRPRRLDMTLPVGNATETVTVVAEAPVINTSTSEISQAFRADDAKSVRQAAPRPSNEPSVNVQSLQRRASGVLPVRMEVPRAGTSHRFVKPLVVDEPALVSFRYKRN